MLNLISIILILLKWFLGKTQYKNPEASKTVYHRFISTVQQRFEERSKTGL